MFSFIVRLTFAEYYCFRRCYWNWNYCFRLDRECGRAGGKKEHAAGDDSILTLSLLSVKGPALVS